MTNEHNADPLRLDNAGVRSARESIQRTDRRGWARTPEGEDDLSNESFRHPAGRTYRINDRGACVAVDHDDIGDGSGTGD
jgi:hypothetical protein